jgi:hypothetical protein
MATKDFSAKRVTRKYRQTISATPVKVFPLLCPVREADWLDGWQYDMIYSNSGFAEIGAVFSTPHHGINETIWLITNYDKVNFQVDFARFTPDSHTCFLQISVSANGHDKSFVDISYTYTAISEQGNIFIDSFTEESFLNSVQFWEEAMNYYIKTGKKLEMGI